MSVAAISVASANDWLRDEAHYAFGDRSVEIARSISRSPDGHHLYAAVADVETDVVRLDD